MLGSLIGRFYRRTVHRLLGLDELVERELPQAVRHEVDAALYAFVGGGQRLAVDVERTAYLLAAASSARYFLDHMHMARNRVRREDLLAYSLEQCVVDGLVLEFGVYRGDTLRLIAERTSGPVYGFDSFEGLPEDWTHRQKKGRFSLGGAVPRFEQSNVTLVPGWFERTLPDFLERHPGPVRFIHVDADLYSSAVTILSHLGPRIVSGTVIQFDEYFNYPGWEQHEFRAFQEFVRTAGRRYEYLGFASSQQAVAVRMQ